MIYRRHNPPRMHPRYDVLLRNMFPHRHHSLSVRMKVRVLIALCRKHPEAVAIMTGQDIHGMNFRADGYDIMGNKVS